MESEWASIKWTIVDRIVVLCVSGGNVPDGALYPLIEAASSASIDGFFTIALGTAATTSTQRSDCAKALKKKGVKSVVLTDSRVTRGIITAIGWFGGDIHAYPLNDVDGGLDALGLKDSRRAAVSAAAIQMRAGILRAQALKRAAS